MGGANETANPGAVRVVADDTLVEVRPDGGATVTAFRVAGTDMLRPARGPDVADQGMFVMAPWVHDIAGGRFFTGDRFVSMRPNHPGRRDPIHGQAWQLPWQVDAVERSRIRLSLVAGGDEWPWRYEVQQRLSVEPGRLDVSVDLTNRDDTPMPAGLGFHMTFERPARLTATVDGAWTPGEDGRPMTWVDRTGFRSTDIDGVIADASYTGWDGRAVVEKGDARIDLASGFEKLHVTAHRGMNLFTLAPATAGPDALNHPERGLHLLSPGETLDGHLRVTVRHW